MSRPPATSRTTCGEREDGLLRAERRDHVPVGIELDAEAARRPARHRLAQLRQADRGGIAHPLAHALAQGLDDARVGGLARVAHPEVDHLEPVGAARGGASLRRTNGYVACPLRMGEIGIYAPVRNASSVVVRLHESVDLDELVAAVRVAGRTRAEVDRVDAARREVGDVRPRLLRLEREVAGVAQRADERRVGDDRGRRRVAGERDRGAVRDERARGTPRRSRATGRAGSGS